MNPPISTSAIRPVCTDFKQRSKHRLLSIRQAILSILNKIKQENLRSLQEAVMTWEPPGSFQNKKIEEFFDSPKWNAHTQSGAAHRLNNLLIKSFYALVQFINIFQLQIGLLSIWIIWYDPVKLDPQYSQFVISSMRSSHRILQRQPLASASSVWLGSFRNN